MAVENGEAIGKSGEHRIAIAMHCAIFEWENPDPLSVLLAAGKL